MERLVLVSMAISVGIFTVIAVGLADVYFLGQVSGVALSAVGFTNPVIIALTSFSIGVSAWANAALTLRIGKGSRKEETCRLGRATR